MLDCMEHAPPPPAVRLSGGDGSDARTVAHLAALAGTKPPRGPVLIAEQGDVPVAAISLADGHAVSDPARWNPYIAALLRMRRIEARMLVAIWGV